MPIFGQENVHSVKITLFHGPKKSIECLFFQKNALKYTIKVAKKSETPLQNTL